jgi:heterodisulfide reductase subunit C2
MPILKVDSEVARGFALEVIKKSGQDLYACYQCRTCASGCPVADESGISPDQLIRSILLGDKEKALNNLLIWKCVSCYTCGVRCPNSIQTAKINEVLRQMSGEAGVTPRMLTVESFHSAFMKSVSHLGRVSEIECMILYAWNNSKGAGGWKDVFEEMKLHAGLGREMLKKRRLRVGPEKVSDLGEVRRLYRKSRERQGL